MTTMTPAELLRMATEPAYTLEQRAAAGRQWVEEISAELARDLFQAAVRAPRTAETLRIVEAEHAQLLRWREEKLAQIESMRLSLIHRLN